MNTKAIPAILGAAVAVTAIWQTATPVRADPEVSKEIIAVQLRKQGFPCKNPVSATRDKPDSEADEAAWILVCDSATYKVRLIPKMAAKVERLDDEEEQAAPQESAAPQR